MTDETQIQDLKHLLKIPAPLFFCFTLLDELQCRSQDPSQALSQPFLPLQVAPAV